MILDPLLNYAVQNKCSDLHIRSEAVPMVRLNGDLIPVPDARIIGAQYVQKMIDEIMTEAQRTKFHSQLDLDFTIQTANGFRFRVNAFKTLTGCAAVFRVISGIIPDLHSIHAPQPIHDLANARKGLILMTGPTGSGKSTTLAAMLDFINNNKTYNIITIEDPVEFVHQNKKSLITQREVGNSTLSFDNALKSALREDPDVILVGEMRSLETIQLALTAAETGHLVLATLHTNSAAQAINRIIDVFPAEDKLTIRSMLSVSLRAVISQRLLKTVQGGRRAAYEIMLSNSSIRNLIREDKVPQIQTIIELNKKNGMITLKDSILELLSNGLISKQIADEAIYANE